MPINKINFAHLIAEEIDRYVLGALYGYRET